MKLLQLKYHTEYGNDTILVQTNITNWDEIHELPPFTNKLLESWGILDADVEGENCTEEIYPYQLIDIDMLPELNKIPVH